MSKLETNQVDPSTGTTLTLGTSGDTIAIPSGVTIANSGTATGFAANTPAFEAYLSDDVRINDDAVVKVAADTEVFDTDNCYDNSTNYRFTPTTAGKYFVYARATFDEAANNLQMCALRVYKNGSNIATARTNFDNQYGEGATPVITTVVDMNGSSDYLEMYAQADSSNGSQITLQGNATERETNFGAYKLIGV